MRPGGYPGKKRQNNCENLQKTEHPPLQQVFAKQQVLACKVT